MIPFDKIPKRQTAILYHGRQIDYGELLANSQPYQKRLESIKESVILLPMKQEPETIYKLVACIRANKIFVPIPEDEPIAKAETLKNELSSTVLWLNDFIYFKAELPQLQLPKDTLFIGFTSGTTGERKGFVRNKESWLHSFAIFQSVSVFAPKPYVTCLTPLHYSLGLYVLLQTLSSGQTYLLDVTTLTDLLTMPDVLNHSQVFSVPTVLIDQLSAIGNVQKQCLSIILSGEVVSINQRKQLFEQMPNAQVLTFYGSSETSFIAYNAVPYPPDNCVGTLFPQVSISIAENDQAIGEIRVTSPMTFQGYLKKGRFYQASATIATGDMGWYDQQLFYLGREDDRINRKGEKYFPATLEKRLNESPYIKDVVVYGYPDAKLGQGIAADIVWVERSLSLDELNQFLKTDIYRKGKLDTYQSVADIQYNDSGKKCKKR